MRDPNWGCLGDLPVGDAIQSEVAEAAGSDFPAAHSEAKGSVKVCGQWSVSGTSSYSRERSGHQPNAIHNLVAVRSDDGRGGNRLYRHDPSLRV